METPLATILDFIQRIMDFIKNLNDKTENKKQAVRYVELALS